MKDLELLEELVLDWAEDRGILKNGTKLRQAIKTVEEVHELLEATYNEDRDETIDAIGDVAVCIIILAKMNGITLSECLGSAYDVIKKRSGVMTNGTFQKSE